MQCFAGTELASGCDEEVEIRGCSIWGTELIVRRMKETCPGMKVNAVLVDFYLWDYAKACQESMKDVPIHHTFSVFY